MSFEYVTVVFTLEEWQDLDDGEETLYKDVILESYNNLAFLG